MRSFLSWPIRVHMLLLVLLLALPAIGVFIYSGIRERKEAVEESSEEVRKLVHTFALHVELLVDNARQLSLTLSHLSEVQDRNAAALNPLLKELSHHYPYFTMIFITDKNGVVWASSQPIPKGRSLAGRRYVKDAIATAKFSAGEFAIGKVTGLPTFSFGFPLMDNKGGVTGIVGIALNLKAAERLLARTQLPDDASYGIFDHNGTFLFCDSEAGRFVGTKDRPDLLRQMQSGTEQGTFEAQIKENMYYRVAYRKLRLASEQPPYMYIRVGIPVESATRAANSALLKNMVLFAPFLVSALALGWFVGRRCVVDRVHVLQTASRSLAAGDLTTRVADRVSGGELGELAHAIDSMAIAMQSHEQALREAHDELEHRVEVRSAELASTVTTLKIEVVERIKAELSLKQEVEQRQKALELLRENERVMIQQSRQAAMGEMISNIAHQWRQPLNTLGMLIQRLQMFYDMGEFSTELLGTSTREAMRLIKSMSGTIDNFSNFFKPEEVKVTFSVNETIRRTISLIEVNFKHQQINLTIRAEGDPQVNGYPNEYSQALLNILLNARDAFAERNIGEARITVHSCMEDATAVVTIADNAGGIPEEIMDKIFDPHFTTKGPKGTGIGLFMAKNIIERNMNGRLTVSNTEHGAEFRIEI